MKSRTFVKRTSEDPIIYSYLTNVSINFFPSALPCSGRVDLTFGYTSFGVSYSRAFFLITGPRRFIQLSNTVTWNKCIRCNKCYFWNSCFEIMPTEILLLNLIKFRWWRYDLKYIESTIVIYLLMNLFHWTKLSFIE